MKMIPKLLTQIIGVRPQPAISDNKRSPTVRPVQLPNRGLSLTAKQTFEIPQSGSVPNRGGWRRSLAKFHSQGSVPSRNLELAITPNHMIGGFILEVALYIERRPAPERGYRTQPRVSTRFQSWEFPPRATSPHKGCQIERPSNAESRFDGQIVHHPI